MLVHDVMHHPVLTTPADARLLEAYRIMEEHDIRHLPVMDRGRLAGIITDRDIRYATRPLQDDPSYARTSISEVMTTDPATAGPLDPVEDAARVMRDGKIGCLPVVDGAELVGIVTITDLLGAIIRLTGLEKPGGRLAVSLSDRPGQFAALTARIAERDLDVRSVLSYYEDAATDDEAPSPHLRVILRVDTIDVHPIAEALRKEGFDVVWPLDEPSR